MIFTRRIFGAVCVLVCFVSLICLASCGADSEETGKSLVSTTATLGTSVTQAAGAQTSETTWADTTVTTVLTTTIATTTTTATTSTTTTTTVTTTTVATTTTASAAETTAETTTATVVTTTVTEIIPAHAGLYAADTLMPLYQKGSDERIYPASLTKLLTACTALEYVSSDTVFTVGSELNLVNSGSSLCLISQGHSLTLYDLLTGMLMSSGNDAAYTIAVNVARLESGNPNLSDADAVAHFVDLMNGYAEYIGMENSNFVNPDGWDNENQYTTVEDLAVISTYAIGNTEIAEIVSCYSKYVVFESGQSITWNSTNALLNPDGQYYCEDAIGLKTGSTANAGKCLIAVFEEDDKRYIAISAGCTSEEQRFGSVLELYSMID